MAIDNSKEIFDFLYKNIDGRAISLAAKTKLTSWYMGHIYGEVTYRGFLRILALVKPNKNEVFYDLGSGTGKAVLLAAMLTDFSKVVGVELLKDLYDTSLQIANDYKKFIGQDNISPVNFIHGDFKETDFSDADVIFMNATCWKYDFDLLFLRKLEQLKKGTRIIMSSMCLELQNYTIKSIGHIDFSWGKEEVFIHEKLT